MKNCLTKYAERTFKKLRQNLLNTVLKQEMEKMRKQIFPWKRRKLLNYNIKIKEAKLDWQTLGQYENNRDKNKYNYTHTILIQKSFVYAVNKLPFKSLRKRRLKQLRKVIQHELCHAFVYERYECVYSNLSGKNADASPIFLAVLTFVDGISNYDFINFFEESELYNTVKKFKKFEELDNYLFDLLYEYNQVAQLLKEESNVEEFTKLKINNYNLIQNKFEFASRTPGLEKNFSMESKTVMTDTNGRLRNTNILSNTFRIGFNVMPEDIERLYYRKKYKQGRYYNNTKCAYVVYNKNNLRKIYEKEDKNY
ncbi:hypothetical protein [Wukongibacter sp. M2B1]|uniref:hypothetical protein n=1 Tax=Wukongibacter sp. M2B1 TaxID=3088895 RepID=UPI003D78E1C3